MPGRIKLKRKSHFVDERALSRAKKALGVKTEAEVIRYLSSALPKWKSFGSL